MLSVTDNTVVAEHTEYFLSKEDIKEYNILISSRNFDQPVKNEIGTCNNLTKLLQVKETTIQIIACLVMHN